MFKLPKEAAGLFVSALILTSAGFAIATSYDDDTIELKKSLRLACENKISDRTPHGQRDLKTLSYRLESPKVGMAKGSLKTELHPGRWLPLTWTCRINPSSGRVLNVEMNWSSGGSRLLAASRLRN